eukprot:358192-Chlamydomonas_euryale.AAC.15
MPLLDSVAGISVGCSSVCLPATCSAAWPACCVPHAGCADSTRSCELSWLNAPAAPSSTLVAGLSTSFWNCCSCIASCALPPWPGRPAMASPRARQLPRCSALRLAPYKSPDAHMRRGMCSGVSSCDGWWSGAGSLLPLTTVVFSSMLPMLCSVVPARLLRDTLLELFIAVALAPRPLALPLAPLAPAPLGCMAAALGARLPRRRSTLQALNHDVKVARSMPCTSCTTMYTYRQQAGRRKRKEIVKGKGRGLSREKERHCQRKRKGIVRGKGATWVGRQEAVQHQRVTREGATTAASGATATRWPSGLASALSHVAQSPRHGVLPTLAHTKL